MPMIQSAHLLGIEGLSPAEITALLDLAEHYALANRDGTTNRQVLAGLTQINLFFEASTAPRPVSNWQASGWARM